MPAERRLLAANDIRAGQFRPPAADRQLPHHRRDLVGATFPASAQSLSAALFTVRLVLLIDAYTRRPHRHRRRGTKTASITGRDGTACAYNRTLTVAVDPAFT